MTLNIANVDVTTDNFSAWLTKTNQLLEAIRHSIATVSNTTVSSSTGNGVIVGNWTADTLVANTVLRGGNNSSSNTLAISSNVAIANTLSVHQVKVHNSTVNVVISVPTAAQQTNTSIFLHANGSWVYINPDTFTGTANNALHLGGVVAAEYVKNTGNYTISGVHTHTGNLIISTSAGIIANGGIGLPGELLKSNGTSVYWEAVAGLALPGSNSWIVFNDSGDFGANESFYFISANSTVVVGNSTVNTTLSNTGLTLANSTITTTLTRNSLSIGTDVVVNSVIMTTGSAGFTANTSAAKVGANVIANTTTVKVGNSTLYGELSATTLTMGATDNFATYSTNNISIGFGSNNVTVNAHIIRVVNISGSANLTPTSLTIAGSVVNATHIAVGANSIINTTAALFGNSTVNNNILSTSIAIANSSANVQITSSQVAIANSTSNTKLTIPTAAERSGFYTLHANGSWVQTAGKTAIPIPASAIYKRTTSGPANGTYETATNINMHSTLDFDGSAAEYGQFVIMMPSSWNESTLTFKPYMSRTTGGSGSGVTWKLQAVSFSNNESTNAAFGATVSSIVTAATSNTLYIGPESSAMTVAGSPAAGDLVMFQVFRDPTDGSDNLTLDARLHGLTLYITTDSMVDS